MIRFGRFILGVIFGPCRSRSPSPETHSPSPHSPYLPPLASSPPAPRPVALALKQPPRFRARVTKKMAKFRNAPRGCASSERTCTHATYQNASKFFTSFFFHRYYRVLQRTAPLIYFINLGFHFQGMSHLKTHVVLNILRVPGVGEAGNGGCWVRYSATHAGPFADRL